MKPSSCLSSDKITVQFTEPLAKDSLGSCPVKTAAHALSNAPQASQHCGEPQKGLARKLATAGTLPGPHNSPQTQQQLDLLGPTSKLMRLLSPRDVCHTSNHITHLLYLWNVKLSLNLPLWRQQPRNLDNQTTTELHVSQFVRRYLPMTVFHTLLVDCVHTQNISVWLRNAQFLEMLIVQT